MDPSPIVIPDHVPQVWPEPAGGTCACASPLPEVRATRKGAARTHCARCGRPIRLDFSSR
jgi:hypothetical protein